MAVMFRKLSKPLDEMAVLCILIFFLKKNGKQTATWSGGFVAVQTTGHIIFFFLKKNSKQTATSSGDFVAVQNNRSY